MRGLGLGGVGRECGMRNTECGVKKKSWLSFCILYSAFCIGWAAVGPAVGADNDVEPAVGKGLLSNLFHEKPKTQVKKENKPTEIKPRPPSSTETAAAEQQRHMNALLRRMEVCDRLQMIANQTGNEALGNQASELEERAKEIYRRQTAGLALPAQAPLTVLAADRENSPSRDRKTTLANAPLRRPNDRNADNLKRASIDSPARLGGNMDQREQAILNGTSMGEK